MAENSGFVKLSVRSLFLSGNQRTKNIISILILLSYKNLDGEKNLGDNIDSFFTFISVIFKVYSNENK